MREQKPERERDRADVLERRIPKRTICPAQITVNRRSVNGIRFASVGGNDPKNTTPDGVSISPAMCVVIVYPAIPPYNTAIVSAENSAKNPV